MQPQLIDNVDSLITFLDTLGDYQGQPPSLYIDLEGNNLSRHGTISLMTILVDSQQKLYLIDVTTLKDKAFNTAGSGNRIIRSVLESKDIIKVFFDIRNDSDALYSLYGIGVDGIEDLQLMELASRNFSKRCINGLAKFIEGLSTIGYAEKREWRKVKDNGRKLFDPAQGGSYSVFDQRPLSQDVLDYCAQDNALMPQLRKSYCAELCDAWWIKIANETKNRIQQSQQPGYNGKGRHMALGPTSFSGYIPTPTEMGMRTMFEISRPRPEPVMEATSSKKTRPPSSKQPEAPGNPAPSEQPEPLGPIAAALQESMLALRRFRIDSDEDEHDYPIRSYYGSQAYGSCWGNDSDSGGDLNACDKECGYCGRCPY